MHLLLHDFSPATLAGALDANEQTYWAYHLPSFPTSVLHESAQMVWFETETRHDVFNRVLCVRLMSDQFGPVDHVLQTFWHGHRPFLWRIGPSSFPAHLGAYLQERGMTRHETEPGMVLDLRMRQETSVAPCALTIERVTTDAMVGQWVQVWEHESSEEVRDLWTSFYTGPSHWQQGPMHMYLGLLEGHPVATAGVFFGAGVASIGPIGTLPAYRRQGIGRAMTWAAIHDAQLAGYRIALLTASPMGIGTYRRLGFREFCSADLYLWHPSPGE